MSNHACSRHAWWEEGGGEHPTALLPACSDESCGCWGDHCGRPAFYRKERQMFAYRSRTSLGPSGLWLISAAFAAALVLSTPGARAQGGASAALDIPAANDALVAERLLAQFYNLNSGKPYLTGTQPVSTAPGTPARA